MVSKLKKHKIGPRSISDLVDLRKKSLEKNPPQPSTKASPSSEIGEKMKKLGLPKLGKKKEEEKDVGKVEKPENDKPMLSLHIYSSKGNK